MAISILQELDLNSSTPNFKRDVVKTIAELSSSSLARKYPDLFEINCLEDGCRYRLDKTRNPVDPVLGQWRKVERLEMAPASEGTLGEEVTLDYDIGFLLTGETLKADSTWQDVVRMITTPYEEPTINITVSTEGVTLDPDTNVIWIPSNLSGTQGVASVDLVYEITSGSESITGFEVTVEDGSTTTDITPNVPVSDNINGTSSVTLSDFADGAEELTVTTTVTDKRKDNSKVVTIDKSGAPVFFGIDGRMEEDWPAEWDRDPLLFLDWHPIDTYYTEENLNGLQQLTKDTTLNADTLSSTTFHITTNSPDSGGPVENYLGGTVVFAFPKEFGEIKSLMFNNFEYTDLQTAETTVRGVPYWVSRVRTCVYSYQGDGSINLV